MASADRVVKEIIGGAVGRLKPGSAGSRYLCDVVHTAVKENGSSIDVDVIRPFFCTYDGSGNPKAPEENTDASKYFVSPLVLEVLQSLQATKGDFLTKAGQLAVALEEDSSTAKDRNDVVSKIVLRWKEVMAACLDAGLPHYVKANNGTLQATNPLACDWEALSVAGGKTIYDEISDVCSEFKLTILKDGLRSGLVSTSSAGRFCREEEEREDALNMYAPTSCRSGWLCCLCLNQKNRQRVSIVSLLFQFPP